MNLEPIPAWVSGAARRELSALRLQAATAQAGAERLRRDANVAETRARRAARTYHLRLDELGGQLNIDDALKEADR